MDSAQLIATVLGAGGGGAVVLAIINGIIKWASGASGRERERNTSLESQRRQAVEERNKANDRADESAVRRRQIEEYASQLRRQLIENGLEPGEWPDLSKTIPKAQLRRARAQQKETP